MVFNKEPSWHAVDSYLREAPSFDDVLITLFSHGVDSIGLVPIEQWRRLGQHAARGGGFIGVDERAFSRDFAVSSGITSSSSARFAPAIRCHLPSRSRN
jgi:hypothetical protein